ERMMEQCERQLEPPVFDALAALDSLRQLLVNLDGRRAAIEAALEAVSPPRPYEHASVQGGTWTGPEPLIDTKHERDLDAEIRTVQGQIETLIHEIGETCLRLNPIADKIICCVHLKQWTIAQVADDTGYSSRWVQERYREARQDFYTEWELREAEKQEISETTSQNFLKLPKTS
ncbi:MAG: hypothetical protein QM270_02140, partial [Bacillota bacterium]|nr:hypothetical protein [Bacillota bacterium]